MEDPVNLTERRALAERTCGELDLPLPTLVDELDDTVGLAYAAWPERLFLIDREGRVAYVGGPGPFEFDPESWERAIRELP